MKKIFWNNMIEMEENNIIDSDEYTIITKAVPCLHSIFFIGESIPTICIKWVCNTNEDKMVILYVYYNISEDNPEYLHNYLYRLPFYEDEENIYCRFLHNMIESHTDSYVLLENTYKIESSNLNLDMSPMISFNVFYPDDNKVLNFKMTADLFVSFNYINNYIENYIDNKPYLNLALINCYNSCNYDKSVRIFNIEKIKDIKDIICINKKKREILAVCDVSQEIGQMTLTNTLILPYGLKDKYKKLKCNKNYIDYVEENYISNINNFMSTYCHRCKLEGYDEEIMFIRSYNKADGNRIFMISRDKYEELINILEQKLKEYK